jgi:hypothetical protein
MPYIDKSRRISFAEATNTGELNYELTGVIRNYLQYRLNDHPLKTENNYNDYNDVIGALESCKLEFYRRVVVPYEKRKMKENGDVYDRRF